MRADLFELWTSVAPRTGAGAREPVCGGRFGAGHGDSDPGSVDAGRGLDRREQPSDGVGRLQDHLGADGRAARANRTGYRHAYVNATGAGVPVSARTSTLFGGWPKAEELAHPMHVGLSALPATIAGTVLETSDAEGRL